MKNKLIALLLAAICTLTPVTSFAEGEELTQTDTVNTGEGVEAVQDEPAPELELTQNQKLAVDLMTAIGTIDKDADLTKAVTRAEFAHAIYYASNSSNQSQTAASVYADIDSKSAYLNEISTALDMGYMSGNAGLFRPDDNITFMEAASVMIKLLGVQYLADALGGYPQGYLNLTNTYDLYSGVNYTKEYVSTLDMALLLTNLFEAEIKDNTYSTTNIRGYYMTSVHNIVRVRGMVTDNGYTSLDGSESVRGYVKIGNGLYASNGVSTKNLLGKKVMAYCSAVDAEESRLYAAVAIDDQKSLFISGDDLVSYENRTYTYDSGNLRKKAEIELEHNVIYNGRLVTDGTPLTRERMVPGEGSVELIDTNGNNKYDTVIINYFETFVVNTYNIESTVLTSINDQPKITLKDADISLEMYMCQGDAVTPITYQNINHYGYALSIARSFDDKIVEIYLSADHKTGVVEGVDYSEQIYTIDGEEYKAADTVDFSLGTGETAEFYFNQFGHIIHWKRQGDTAIKYAYVEKYYPNESGDGLCIRVYTEDNIYLIATLKNPTVIDSVKVSGVENQSNALLAASVTNNLIRYKLNSHDEITWIDTLTVRSGEDASNSMNILYENASNPAFDKGVYAWGETYASKYPTSKYTKVFVAVPGEKESVCVFTLEDFCKQYASAGETRIGASLQVVNTDSESIIGTMAIVKRTAMSSVSTSRMSALKGGAIVTKIAESITDENEPVYLLDVQMGSNEETITIPRDLLEFNSTTAMYSSISNDCKISLGDMIRWEPNLDGEIKEGGLFVMFDYDREHLFITGGDDMSSPYKRDNSWHYLWAYDKEDEFMISVNDSRTSLEQFVSGEKTRNELSTFVDYIEPLNSTRTSVYVYDEDNGFYLSDMGEIQTYMEAGASATKFLGRYSGSGHRLIIVFKYCN